MWLTMIGLNARSVPESTPRRLSSAATPASVCWSSSWSISAITSGGVRRSIAGSMNGTRSTSVLPVLKRT